MGTFAGDDAEPLEEQRRANLTAPDNPSLRQDDDSAMRTARL
jgi:hypothetical protein